MPDPDARHSFLRPLAYWIFVTLAVLVTFFIVRKLTLCRDPTALQGNPSAAFSLQHQPFSDLPT